MSVFLTIICHPLSVEKGVVIAVGAAVGIYFRRAKKKLNDKLGIDENRNKEVKSDDIVVTNSDKDGE